MDRRAAGHWRHAKARASGAEDGRQFSSRVRHELQSAALPQPRIRRAATYADDADNWNADFQSVRPAPKAFVVDRTWLNGSSGRRKAKARRPKALWLAPVRGYGWGAWRHIRTTRKVKRENHSFESARGDFHSCEAGKTSKRITAAHEKTRATVSVSLPYRDVRRETLAGILAGNTRKK
jgi:hypothetical protein